MTEENKRTAGAPASKRVGLSSELIGHTAGELWRVLADRGGQPLSGIKKTIDAPDEVIMAAVGWLAREDKLAFETDGRTVTVSLL